METKTYRTRHDYPYFLVAFRYYKNFSGMLNEFKNIKIEYIEELKKENIESLTEDNASDRLREFLKDDHVKDLGSKVFAVRTFGNIVILHSAMCLESFINDYCVVKKSGNYFKKYIEQLDVISKWIIVPKIIANNEIPTDSRAFELLKKLVSTRNKLVHPKSRELTRDDDGNKLELLAQEFVDFIEDVALCMGAVLAMLVEFKKIDPDFYYLKDYMWLWDKEAEFRNLSDIRNIFSIISSEE